MHNSSTVAKGAAGINTLGVNLLTSTTNIINTVRIKSSPHKNREIIKTEMLNQLNFSTETQNNKSDSNGLLLSTELISLFLSC